MSPGSVICGDSKGGARTEQASTVAANGDPWYTMMAANKIATLQLR
jgi:hypothetical protein